MREIKFREWDPLREEMYGKGRGMSYSERCEFDDMTGFYFDHEEGDDNRGPEKDMVGDPVRRLMQYTGQKDNTGRDIYEEDIVRVAGVTDPGMKWVVTWSNASWELHYVLGRKYMNPMRLGTMSVPIEVVGNIWENPELLEASK